MGKKSGVTELISSQTAVKVLRIAVRMDKLLCRDWDEIKIALI